ncbi:MarR family winged helix-turn-helix transcriptional regulator [Croceicoccus marinus]|uniref:MarR family transcriptional regulator n=1 Tax=Croceicoccus marinus TaxID=450378 RepID=A0A1Z1FGB6_9SPHN|nr:MarR family transcriptional regulator [Croceicoccus marinus]ARU17851.1 MarR family transcriptional regulator [Croceicoccus marinus]QNE07353.1 MarR family transcriptional regulator [Croceicoccus marinus]
MNEARDNLGPLDRLAGYHFRRTSSAMRKDFEKAVDGLGISQVSFAVLSVISANPGIRQGEVGRMLDIQRANMVTMIGDLTKSELVTRGRDESDRRAVTLSLTPRGQDQLAASLARIQAREAKALEGLDEKQVAALIATLNAIRRNCENAD